ncbi:MAG: type II toxin-antitoxin system VapB family antitoxin [Candidatus Aminicenantes bacterium]|nr:type II toxin-antitoxin system VapB family antitoxin [Candidatus Aminicenantes bacterium]
MPMNLAIEDDLINEAKKIGNHKTKKSAVTEVLKEYIRRHKQNELKKMFGRVEIDMDYDYKTSRKSR